MTHSVDSGRAERRWWWLVVGAALFVWAWYSIPVLSGERTLFLRDVMHNHWGLKWLGAEALKAGEIPTFTERAGNGLVYAGNPSALPFYPGNLLYLILPFWNAFNAHFVFHWLLAACTMFWLARAFGIGRWGALVAAIAYAGGGWFMSALTFYNIATVAAWWPAAITGAYLGGRNGIAAGGLACGLALLGGEPITALLGTIPLLVVATSRHGLRRGVGTTLAIGILGLLVALPQIVASSQVLSHSFRGFRGAAADEEAAGYVFRWVRVLELLLPLPFGHPAYKGPHGWWLSERLAFYFSLHAGLVAVWLATRTLKLRTARPWWLLAVLGVLLAWMGGASPKLLIAASGGLFRFPEKFLFWLALALPILAGYGLDEMRLRVADPGRRRRVVGSLFLALSLALASVAVLRAAPAVVSFLTTPETNLDGRLNLELALLAQSQLLALQAGFAALLLATLAWVVSRGSVRMAAWIAGLQLLSVLPLTSLFITDSTAPHRQPSEWLRRLPRGAALYDTLASMPPWGKTLYRLEGEHRRIVQQVDAQSMTVATALPIGIDLPLLIDSEGMGQATYTFLMANLFFRPWSERVQWLRALGVEYVIAAEDPDLPELEPVDARRFAGSYMSLQRVKDPLPFAAWPREVLPEPSPVETLRRIGRLGDIRRTVLTERPVAGHQPGAAVRVDERHNDRVVVHVEGDGGLLFVRRQFSPLWRAWSGDQRLRTVEVPPGVHDVVLDVSKTPQRLAIGISVLASLAMLFLARSLVRRAPTSD
jgi:hypothetical protein